MSHAIAEHSLFKLKPSKAETKADVTNHAARAIIGDEDARREAKTARLKQARLAQEASEADAPAKPAAKTARKTPAKRRSPSRS